MANPQKEDGYTPIANELLSAICGTRIPGEARQVFDVILIKTYGWSRKQAKITLKEFEQETGIKKPNIIRAINVLVEMNLIILDTGKIIENDNKLLSKKITINTMFKINKDFDTWKKKDKKIIENDNKSITIKLNTKNKTNIIENDNNEKLSKKIINIIENDNNENFTSSIKTTNKEVKNEKLSKKIIFAQNELKKPLPEFLDPDLWEDFRQLRKEIKKPLTPTAEKMALKKLIGLHAENYDCNRIISRSIENSWQGLFPKDDDKKPKVSQVKTQAERAAEQQRKVLEAIS